MNLAEELVESDQRYFELGAAITALPGAVLASMPGLEAFPASAVVHRVDVGLAEKDPDRWLDTVTGAFDDAGIALARIYLAQRPARLEAALGSRGFRHRVEFGYVADGPLPAPEMPGLRLVDRPAASTPVDPTGWGAPDGHRGDERAWRELEARKAAATGDFCSMAVVDDTGTEIAAISVLLGDRLVRMKNLRVHTSHRRTGVARWTLALVQRTHAAPARPIGWFGVEQSEGDELYRALGMRRVCDWHEWSRPSA